MSKNETDQPPFLTTSYDKRDELKEIESHLHAIHDFCQRHSIPYIFAACPFVDAEAHNHEFRASVYLIGPERTPPALVVANQTLQNGIAAGVRVAAAVTLAGYSDGDRDEEEVADPAEGLDAAQVSVPGSFGNA